MNAAIVILAAGQASRMGRPKQLLPWADTTLVGHAVEQATSCRPGHCYVVTGASGDRVGEALKDHRVSVVYNPNYTEGLGSSIRVAIAHIDEVHPAVYTHVLIMLADQPAVDAAYLSSLLELAAATSQMVATDYGKRLGVPAVFPAAWFARLRQLGGDAGAGQLLNATQSGVQSVTPPFDLYDIDTPEDYRRHEGNT